MGVTLKPRMWGVNVVSFFPWCLGPNGPRNSIKMAKLAGYRGIQALPIRGWDYSNLCLWEDDVVSFEDAWNYGLFWKALWNTLVTKRYNRPSLIDWVLFGKEMSTYFPHAVHVAHDWETPGSVVEIHPEICTKHGPYIKHALSGGKLCWDTLHIRRPHRETGESIRYWERLLYDLPSESICLIHVHPSWVELDGFLDERESELTKMLTLLNRKAPNATAIVEIFPPLKSVEKTVARLKKTLWVAGEWLR